MKNVSYRWLAFCGILIFSGMLSYSATYHAIASQLAASSNPDSWARAAKIEPSNPYNWYHLARYRQLDFEHGDLPLAISYYRRAVAIEPVSPLYWSDLASAYEVNGDDAMAEEAYRTAQQDYPISGDIAWRYGSFLLRQGRLQEGFHQIQRALSVEPSLITLAMSRCWRTTQDVNLIMNSALPPTSKAYWGAIDFLMENQQKDGAVAAWKKLVAEKIPFSMMQAAPLIDFLLQHYDAVDAQTVWKQSLSASGITRAASGDSLMWDGGFEQDMLNEGFAWRYGPAEGADLAIDENTVHSGRRSFRIAFDGSANGNFENLWQYVAVQPNTTYRLSAYIRTDDLTTDQGVQFQVLGAVPAGVQPPVTPNVVGTQPWTLEEVVFTTSPQTDLIKVTLVREHSNLLANKIRGTAWVDDVALTSASLPPPKNR